MYEVFEVEPITDLRPCPFCGATAVVNNHHVTLFYIGCTRITCQAKVGSADRQIEAENRWNARFDLDAQRRIRGEEWTNR